MAKQKANVANSASKFAQCASAGCRYARYIFGYNCCVMVTMLFVAGPIIAVATFVGHLKAWIWSCIIYVTLETAAYGLERGWSRLRVCPFWLICVPFSVVQIGLCVVLVPEDPLGCLLLSALCLGVREMAFEFSCASCSVGGYECKERFISASLGGFVYAAFATLMCGMAFSIMRVAKGYGNTHTMKIMYFVVLPIVRLLWRMFLTQFASRSGFGLRSLNLAPDGNKSSQPRRAETAILDARVLQSDVQFGLTIFLEVPLVLVVLLAPTSLSFLVAAVANAMLDVLFAFLLDALYLRSTGSKPVTASRARLPKWEHSTVLWSPRFCVERPVSVLATVLNGCGPLDISEADPLFPGRGHDADDGNKEPKLGYMWSSGNADKRSTSSSQAPSTMSPRVSALLDEYDAAVIDCQMGGTGDARALYQFQDKKMHLTGHLLGSTVAVGFAACACIAPKLWSHSSGWYELGWRIGVLGLLRACADLLSCGTLEYISRDIHKHGRAGLWESRHELSNVSSWLFRALIGSASLLTTLAAASTNVSSHS